MRTLTLATAALTLVFLSARAGACPFCNPESRTLSEELADCDYAVLAKLVKPAAGVELGLNDKPQEGVPFGTIDPETGLATFRIEGILLAGEDVLGPAIDEPIEAVFFGEPDFEASYFLRGLGDPLEWTIPLELSPIATEYIQKLQALPAGGGDRLAYFQEYLEHEDPLLAQDAYDEFARAPYADVQELKDRMDREQLLAWIESPTVSPSRRRLYLTMLGVCGRDEDIPRIERLMLADSRALTPAAEALAAISVSLGGPLAAALAPETVRLDQRRNKLGLDAMVACYLTLRGGEGLDVVDDRFLRDQDADYTHVYSSLMALRFLAEENDLVPRERLLESARLLLNNRDFADQVIPDLARWEDWTVLDQLVAMYKGTVTGDYEKYVRDPIVTYLDVAVEQGGELAERANAALAELEPIDPETFRRARSLRAFGFLARANPPSGVKSSESSAANAANEAVGPSDPELSDPGLGDSQLNDAPLDAASAPEASDANFGDIPPDPATFAAATPTPPQQTTPLETENKAPAADEPSATASVATAEAHGASALSQSAPLVAGEFAPPKRWLLVGAPLLAFTLLLGLFWSILRAGGA